MTIIQHPVPVVVYNNPAEAAIWDAIMSNPLQILAFIVVFFICFGILWKVIPQLARYGKNSQRNIAIKVCFTIGVSLIIGIYIGWWVV